MNLAATYDTQAISSHVLLIAAIVARIAPILWLAPFLGGRLVPSVAKVGLSLALAFVLVPLLSDVTAKLYDLSALSVAAVFAKEVFVGFAIGFFVSLTFLAAQSAGALIDTVRGASLSEVLVPQTASKSSPTGVMLLLMSIVLFLSLGGHRIFLMAVATSYRIVPVVGTLPVEGLNDVALYVITLTAQLWAIALALAAPVIAVLLLVEVALGWMNRFVPQINVYFLAMPLRAILGILVLALSLGLMAVVLPAVLEASVAHVSDGLNLLLQ